MLLLKTWRDLLAHKGQFGGIVLAVALGVMMFMALTGVCHDLETCQRRTTTELAFADFSTVVKSAPVSEMAAVRRVPGVAEAEGRLVKDVSLDLGDGTKAKARIVSVPDKRRPRVNALLLQAGSWPVAGRGEALLHTKFAKETGAQPGGSVTLLLGGQRKQVTVAGIVASPEYVWAVPDKGATPVARDFAILFMPELDAGELLGEPGGMTDVAVLLRPGADAPRAIEAVEHVLEPYQVLTTIERSDQASNANVQAQIDKQRSFSTTVPIVFLAVGMSSLFITLSRLVTAQRGEIGLAKALGYSDEQVLGHYLLFALFIAGAGAVVGIVLGEPFAGEASRMYAVDLSMPFMEHTFYPPAVLYAVGISTLTCVLAGVAPAWRSARIPPAQAMHADPNAVLHGGRVPLLERILSPVLPASFTYRVPLRNLFRQKKRTFYTILGLAFAVLMAVCTQSISDTLDGMFARMENVSERWDVQAVFTEPFGADRLAEVRRWTGVTSVEGARVVAADLSAGGVTYKGAVTCMDPVADFHGFEMVAGEEPRRAMAGDRLILPEGVASKLRVAVGDTVSVKSAERDDAVGMKVGGISHESLGAPVFASLDGARRLTRDGRARCNVMYIDARPWMHRAVETRLNDLDGITSVAMKTEMVAGVMNALSFMKSFEGMMLFFCIAIGFAVVHNTVTSNVVERTREIATMRTIGEGSGRIGLMLAIESLLLVVVAIPLGLWLGIRFSDYLYAQMSTESMTFTATVSPTSIAVTAAILLAVVLLSALPSIRRVFRLDLAESTKVLE